MNIWWLCTCINFLDVWFKGHKFLLLFQNLTIKTLRYFFLKKINIFLYLSFSNNLRTWEEERDGAGKLGSDAIIQLNETWKSTNLIHSFNSVSLYSVLPVSVLPSKYYPVLDLRKIYCSFVYKLNGIKNKTLTLLYFWDKKTTTTKYLAKILIFI